MRWLFLCVLLFPGALAHAQIYPNLSWTAVDPCGGRPAWVNSTTVVEDSSSHPSGGTGPCTTDTKPQALTTPLFDLKLVSNIGGTITLSKLSNSTARTALGIDVNCSFGNPDSDGTHLVAIVQQTPGSGPTPCALNPGFDFDPGKGGFYDVLICNSYSVLNTSTCSIGPASDKSNAGAFLDPHIDGNHVYISERNNSSFSHAWPYWSVDDLVVNWTGGPSGEPKVTNDTPYMPGTWSMTSRTLLCEQYYKATSFQHLTNGVTRIFTQANQISNYLPQMSPTCPNTGRTLLTSGIEYFDLTGSPVGGTLTQIYPDPAHTPPQFPDCFTAANNPGCYGEFPIVQQSGNHLFMVFIGLTSTPPAVIDACAMLPGCQANFPSETLMEDLGNNTQMPTPGPVIRQSDFQIPGTTLNTNFLAGGISAGYYGNCAHLSLLASIQKIVCDVRSNNTTVTGAVEAQTVIFPQKYPGSLMFPSSFFNGQVKVNGRAKVN